MGCNIHIHIEVKLGGGWYHYSAPRVDRSYKLFSLMAGVRSDDTGINSLFPVRGLPNDTSWLTDYEYQHDINNFKPKGVSYITAEELPQLQEAYCKVMNTQPADLTTDLEWTVFHTFIQGSSMATHPTYEDLRIVFWFDD